MIKRKAVPIPLGSEDNLYVRCPKLRSMGYRHLQVCMVKPCVHYTTGHCSTIYNYYKEAGYEKRRRKNRETNG